MIRVRSSVCLGAAVRQRREQAGLNQAELASRAGVSRQWLSQFENGKPTVEVSKVLVVLGVLDLRLFVAHQPPTRRRPSATDALVAAAAP